MRHGVQKLVGARRPLDVRVAASKHLPPESALAAHREVCEREASRCFVTQGLAVVLRLDRAWLAAGMLPQGRDCRGQRLSLNVGANDALALNGGASCVCMGHGRQVSAECNTKKLDGQCLLTLS